MSVDFRLLDTHGDFFVMSISSRKLGSGIRIIGWVTLDIVEIVRKSNLVSISVIEEFDLS